jgi:hypothetical protein
VTQIFNHKEKKRRKREREREESNGWIFTKENEKRKRKRALRMIWNATFPKIRNPASTKKTRKHTTREITSKAKQSNAKLPQ